MFEEFQKPFVIISMNNHGIFVTQNNMFVGMEHLGSEPQLIESATKLMQDKLDDISTHKKMVHVEKF